jgi:hypothetical protein
MKIGSARGKKHTKNISQHLNNALKNCQLVFYVLASSCHHHQPFALTCSFSRESLMMNNLLHSLSLLILER